MRRTRMIKAAEFRAMAEKSRSLANTASTRELRQVLLQTAKHYDAEADKLDKRVNPVKDQSED